MRYFILVFLFYNWCICSFAQNNRTEILMKTGKELIRKEKYLEAEKTFKKIFDSKETLPDELCFYYGVSLFKLQKHTRARDFFEKYISLTNKKGDFVNESNKFLKEIEKNVCVICKGNNYFWGEDTCKACNGKSYTTEHCKACQGKSSVVCPSCKGSKLLISVNELGTWYNDCPRCENGTVTCLRCKGIKIEKHTCIKCKGSGTQKVKKVCNHKH